MVRLGKREMEAWSAWEGVEVCIKKWRTRHWESLRGHDAGLVINGGEARVGLRRRVTAPSQHLSIAIRRQQRRRTSQAAGTSRSPAAEETHLAGTSRSPAAEETHLAGTSRSPAAEETHLSIAGSRDAPPDRLPRLRRRQQRRTSRLRIVFLASVAGSRARDAPPGSRSSSSPPSQASVFCSLAEI
ncbi:hypothetical protein ACLOJK_025102 [Asimina triloba]